MIGAFLKSKRSRKMMITLKDRTIVHADGLSVADVEKLLAATASLSAIETEKNADAKAASKSNKR